MKVVTIIGARPQFIKAAMVSQALSCKATIHETIVHTGQHYDTNMSAVFWEDLEIPGPKINLGVGSDTHGRQTGRMLMGIERALLDEGPDYVLVYGDTNSTLAGALAAAKVNIRVGHVEAGLRSYNSTMPEEVNRVLVDHCAYDLFVPTEAARANLQREGVDDESIHLVGDVMYDAARRYGPIADSRSRILEDLGVVREEFVLATVHRAENTDNRDRLAAAFEGLCQVAEVLPVVVPLHPRTRLALERAGLLGGVEERLIVVEPVGYLDMLCLEGAARMVVTDSGGVQKEAYFRNTPCVTMREETEWVELIEAGINTLVPLTSATSVCDAVLGAAVPRGIEHSVEYYGGGHASELIARIVGGYA